MKILILAGGLGKRLWPLTDPPKQFRRFGNPLSLLQLTLVRFLKRYLPKDLHVITSLRHADIARWQSRVIHPALEKQLIVEPETNNTAPAIAYALHFLESELGERFLVTPSDHYFSHEEHFLDQLAFAERHLPAGAHGLFGVTPTFPHMGYGYIEPGSQSHLAKVTSFHEKPNETQAKQLIEKGCLWNTGMILFHKEALQKQLPKDVPAISIDYFLLEKAQNLFVTKLDLNWSDLGTWKGIYEANLKDAWGNVIFGNVQISRVNNCLVFGNEKPQLLSDLEDCVVILSETGEKVIMPFETQIPSSL